MRRKWLRVVTLLAMLLAMAGCGAEPDLQSTVTDGNELEVHIIDVGQADAILIKIPEQGNILIDGGTGETEDELVDYIQKQGVNTLNFVMATHPHEDHIGGLDAVIRSFEVGTVYMPKVSHTTKAFENLLMAISDSGAAVEEAKADVRLPLGEAGAQAMFLAPCGSDYKELNDYSAVLKLVYGQTSFLFTGDAEKLSEQEMLEHYSKKTMAATVLKVGHHGSKTSTSEAFLQTVAPQWAAISVGEGNDYGLPHADTLALLERQGVTYWRTDEVGSIVFYSDGDTVRQGQAQVAGEAAADWPEENLEEPDVSVAPGVPVEPVDSAADGVVIQSVNRVAEIAVLANTGDETVDLSGWVLVSVQGDQRFAIPEGTSLAAGESLRIVSGENAVEGDHQLVWTVQNIWNNKHDPAELYDSAGRLVDQLD